RRQRTGTKRPTRARPVLELLEDRTVLSNYTAATVAQLIADINAANLAGGSNTIKLAAHTDFTLSAVDNTTDGPTGLPVIAAGNNLTINGKGDALARSADLGTPAFRLFDVASGASLTLKDLTLANGLATGTTVTGPETVAPDGEVIVLAGSETLGGGILNK